APAPPARSCGHAPRTRPSASAEPSDRPETSATRDRRRSARRRSCRDRRERSAHDLGEGVDEAWVVVRHFDAVKLEAQLARLALGLRVDVPADLQMIRYEPDGAHEHALDSAGAQLVEVVEDVRA